jgi:DNA-binding transcriptional ArsR family regulator
MARARTHSRIEKELPAEVRHEVDRLLVEENATYAEIEQYLANKGYLISHSSIGRYGKEFLAQYKELRIIEDKSKTLVSEVGDGMNLEEAASKMFIREILKVVMDGSFDVLELPRLVSDFAKLQASSVVRERLKMEIRQKVIRTADEVVKTARSGGLSPEKAEEIRNKILGIV